MEFQHELIIPNEGLPFKIFLFEGGQGHYEREALAHIYRDFCRAERQTDVFSE